MNTIQEYIELLAARNEQIRELQERISGLENELSKRKIELSNLKRLHFGQSSEKMKKPESLDPMPLFPEYDEATVEAIDNTLPPIAPSESGAAFSLCTYGRNSCKRKRSQGQNPQGVSMGYGRRQSAKQRTILLLPRRFTFATSDATYVGRV